MACPFTVKQALTIFRQYAENASGGALAFDKAQLITDLQGFEFEDATSGAKTTLSLADATDLANTYADLYTDFLKNKPKSDGLQRLLDKVMSTMGSTAAMDRAIEQEIDYMMLFAGTSEMVARAEKLELVLMKMNQPDYNWNILKENFYSTLLNSLSFMKSMIIDNVYQSFFRKMLTSWQMRKVPDFNFRGASEMAKVFFNDVIKGGVPINAMMEQELRQQGVFTRNVRASEEGVKPGSWLYTKWAAFSSKWTQRMNNGPDTWGQTMSMERSFFIYLNEVIEREKVHNEVFYDGDVPGAKIIEVNPTSITVQLPDGKKKKVDFTKIKYNPLRASQSSWQKQFAAEPFYNLIEKPTGEVVRVGGIATDDGSGKVKVLKTDGTTVEVDGKLNKVMEGDYVQPLAPGIKVGQVINPGDKIAGFDYTKEGKAKQMEGRGYYYDHATAVQEAEKMYQRAGIFVVDEGPNTEYTINRNSARFKRTAFELERQGRNTSALEAAEKTAMHDFFKNPMGIYKDQKSDRFNLIEIPNQGLFGGVAAMSRAIADSALPWATDTMVDMFLRNATDQKKEAFRANFRVGLFGFINGANAYSENLLEFTPLALVKAGLMKFNLSKAERENAMDLSTKMFYEQRITDLVAKPVIAFLSTGLLFALKFAFEQSGLCEDGGKQPSLDDVRNGNLVVCGRRIPSWMFGMGRGYVGIYNYWLNNSPNWSETAALVAFLSGGRYERGVLAYLDAAMYAQTQEQASDKLTLATKVMTKTITDAMSLWMPMKGAISSNQLFFPDKEVEPTIDTYPKIFKWSVMQSLGMKEAFLSSTGEYNVVDHRGRQVFNNSLKYQIGDGIKYDKYDDFVNDLGIDGKDLYNGRYRKLFNDQKRYAAMGVEPRFMTEKEFHHVQTATGKIFDTWLKDRYDELKAMPVGDEVIPGYGIKEGSQNLVRMKLKELEQVSKDVAEFMAFYKMDSSPEEYQTYMEMAIGQRMDAKMKTFENWLNKDRDGDKDPETIRQALPKRNPTIPF